MMGIWFYLEKKQGKYLKVVLFNSGAVKIVNNDGYYTTTQVKQFYSDGARFLDTLLILFELPFLKLTDLTQWFVKEYA
jgi:hypothetical protein